MRALLLTVFLVACCAARANVAFGDLPEPAAEPGEYLTFAVPLTGNGTFLVEVTAPAGWQLVTGSREVEVAGSRLVPFTVRVPASALADTRAELRVRASGATGSTEGSISVRVRGSSGMTFAEAAPARAAPGEILSFLVRLTNTGNQTDIFQLSGHSPGRLVTVSPEQLQLGPFESGEARVTVPVQGRVGNGYRLPLQLEIVSTNSGEVMTKSVNAVYEEETGGRAGTESRDPELVLRVRTAAQAGVETGAESGTTPFFSWSLQPGLKGELSDFVKLDVSTDGFRSGTDSPFEAPRYTDIQLTAEKWEAALLLGSDRFGVRGALEAAGWRFSGGGHYARFGETAALQLEAGAVSGNPELDLQFQGNLLLAESLHSGNLSGFWRNRLGDNLQLGLGLGISGFGDATGNSLGLTLSESLHWLGQDFDLVQTLTSSPSLGLHSLSLSGGMRSSRPFGIRFLTRFSVTPTNSLLITGAQLSSVPMDSLRLTAGVFYQTAGFGSGSSASVRLQAGAALRLPVGSAGSATVEASGARITGLNDSSPSGSLFSVRVAATFGRFALTGSGSREHWTEPATGTSELKVRLRASAVVTLGAASTLEAGVALDRGKNTDTSFSVRWLHDWSATVSSELRWLYDRKGHRFDVSMAMKNVFTDGLSLGLGYGLHLTPEEVRHRFRAGISYTWIVPFTTPAPVVTAFGGRETGAVSGVARISQGARAGELLPGLMVRLGDTVTETAADGSFTLNVPPGSYRLEFEGLPATLGFAGTRELEVERNQSVTVAADFVPVSVLRVIVFLDADRDGLPSEAENGLAGLVLELAGPRAAQARTDSAGSAWFTGLPEGRYRLGISESSMPRGYEVTTDLPALYLDPGEGNTELHVGIAPVIRQVVTTFDSSATLALSAWASSSSVPAGAGLTVSARTAEAVDAVTVELFGQNISLERSGGLWTAELTVPEGSEGLVRGTVTASSQDGRQAQTRLQLLVTEPR